MKQHVFTNLSEYVGAQRKLTLKKMQKKEFRPFVDPKVMKWIAEVQVGIVETGCCHGVRNGEELKLFEEVFPRVSWVGTEIVKEVVKASNRADIIEHDFNTFNEEFFHCFDIIYSNSFDHALNPSVTSLMWLLQLNHRAESRLYVEWTKWHGKLGRRGNKADCLEASLEEYINIFSEHGVVEDVGVVECMSSRNNPFNRYILQIRRKHG